VPYAGYSDNLFSDIPGADVPSAPYPLLANLGPASNGAVLIDLQVYTAFFRTLKAPGSLAAADAAPLQMMVSANAQERTIGQFISLAEGTGWKLGSIRRNFKSTRALLVFDAVSF